SIADPGATIELPRDAGPVHHEGELACIVGATARHVAREHALDYVLGYTGLIDFTVRGAGDRSRRKSYDGFTPIGPFLVTADELLDPSAVSIRLDVNGETRQLASAADMLVGVAEIVAYASSVMTLCPGDVIATGSPPGVAAVAPGDHVRL